MSLARIILLFFGIAAIAAPPRSDTLKRFLVKNVEGTVLAWEPWSSNWSQVIPGTALWEATLVQIGEDSSLTFEMESTRGIAGVSADAVEITLNKPTVLRLADDVLREVDLSTFFAPEGQASVIQPKEGEMLSGTLREAWKKVAAVLVRRGFNPAWIPAVDRSQGDANLAMRAKPIKIYTPGDGMTVIAERLPVESRITWKKVPDPKARYEVRVWRAGAERPGPLIVTPLDFHIVKLQAEGGYYVQITTPDGKYQSPINRIFVALPIGHRLRPADHPIEKAKLPLPLMLPPADFIYLPGRLPVEITLQWDTHVPVVPRQYFEVFVTDATGKILLKRKLLKETLSVKLNQPGAYQWYVHSWVPPRAPEVIPQRLVSDKRTFHIQKAQPLEAYAEGKDPIGDLLLAKPSGVLYLETGF